MQRKLETVAQFAGDPTRPWTLGQIRFWIFNAKFNGLAPALVRIGRRVYIDVDKFYAWIDEQVAA